MFTTVADNYFIHNRWVISKIDSYRFRIFIMIAIFDMGFNVDFFSVICINILAHHF